MEQKKEKQTTEINGDKIQTQTKECSHSNLEKDYYLGSHTGLYICKDCGEEFWGRPN